MVSQVPFQGPLGLLLELIDQRQIEVTEVSIAAITHDYLDRISELQARQDLSQFIDLGTRLVFIKSSALLPQVPNEDKTSELELHQLSQELEEYRAMRDAAQNLERFGRGRGSSFARSMKAHRATSAMLLPLRSDIELLKQAFQTALASSPPVATLRTPRKHYDQALIKQKLCTKLQSQACALHDILIECRDRLEVIVTFAGLLELVKDDQVCVRQASSFGQIYLELTSE